MAEVTPIDYTNYVDSLSQKAVIDLELNDQHLRAARSYLLQKIHSRSFNILSIDGLRVHGPPLNFIGSGESKADIDSEHIFVVRRSLFASSGDESLIDLGVLLSIRLG